MKTTRPSDLLPSWQVGISAAGPSAQISRPTNQKKYSEHEQIERMLKYLQDTQQLREYRPRYWSGGLFISNTGPRFVHETCIAQKIVFPIKVKVSTTATTDIKHLVVWFSNPMKKYKTTEPSFDLVRESFLYLIEDRRQDNEHGEFPLCSGYSVLHEVIDSITEVCHISDRKLSILKDDKHPIDIFSELGGIIQKPRQIKSLYRIRGISPSLYSKDKNPVEAYSDLFGYPIYISEQ
jgi:hypothetical protein